MSEQQAGAAGPRSVPVPEYTTCARCGSLRRLVEPARGAARWRCSTCRRETPACYILRRASEEVEGRV